MKLTTLKSHITRVATATRSTLTRSSHVAWTATAKQLRRLGVWLSGMGPPGLTSDQVRALVEVAANMGRYNSALTVEQIALNIVPKPAERKASDGTISYYLGRFDPKVTTSQIAPIVIKPATSGADISECAKKPTIPTSATQAIETLKAGDNASVLPSAEHIAANVDAAIDLKPRQLTDEQCPANLTDGDTKLTNGDVVPEQHAEVVGVKDALLDSTVETIVRHYGLDPRRTDEVRRQLIVDIARDNTLVIQQVPEVKRGKKAKKGAAS